MQSTNNIKLAFIVLMLGSSLCNNTSSGSCVFGHVCYFTFSMKHVSTRFTLFSHHTQRVQTDCWLLFDKKKLTAQQEGTQVVWH